MERGVIVFDVFNQIVHDTDPTRGRWRAFVHDGHRLPIRVVRADDRYLVFATSASEDALARAFARLEILQPK